MFIRLAALNAQERLNRPRLHERKEALALFLSALIRPDGAGVVVAGVLSNRHDAEIGRVVVGSVVVFMVDAVTVRDRPEVILEDAAVQQLPEASVAEISVRSLPP